MRKYPLWQYPFVFVELAYHFRAWRFWELRKSIRITLAWRKGLGFWPDGYEPTLKDGLSFGHWLVSERIRDLLRLWCRSRSIPSLAPRDVKLGQEGE